MTTVDFLKKLRAQQISIRLKNGNQLSVSSVTTDLAPAVVQEIRTRKSEILQFLQSVDHSQNTLIAKVTEQPFYEVSQAQKRLWVLDQMEDNFRAYNIPSVHYLNGELNAQALQYAFTALVSRHESLRTTFEFREGNPVQVIHPAAGFPEVLELQNATHIADEVLFQEEVVNFVVQHKFALDQGPLFKAKLFRLSAKKHVLALVIHHIISDAWSIRLMIKEIGALYLAYQQGNTQVVENSGIQYKDFASWQNSRLETVVIKAHESYWLGQFGGELPVLNLETDYTRSPQRSYRGGSLYRYLEDPVLTRITKLEQEEGVTTFNILLATVQAFLYRYTGDRDVIVGTTSNGRFLAELQDQIGFYVNILPLRHQFGQGQTFRTLLRQTKTNFLSALAHEEYPFNLLLEKLSLPADQGRHPVFDVLVEHLGMEINENTEAFIPGLEIQAFPFEVPTSKFDFSFRFIDEPGRTLLHLEYDSALFSAAHIESVLEHYLEYVKNLLEALDHPLEEIKFFPEGEKQRLFEELLPVVEEIPFAGGFISGFQEMVGKQGNETALVAGSEQLSYTDLNQASSQLACFLRQEHKVKAGDRVAILADRTPNTVIGILGILKAGATFVPVDPAQPGERLSQILDDADTTVLLLESDALLQLPENYSGKIVVLDMQNDFASEDIPTDWMPYKPGSDEIAYIIYTSGSTGRPKGVQVGQGSLSYYLSWANKYYFSDQSTIPFGLFTSIAFDLTLTGLLGTLLRGGVLHLYSEHMEIHRVLESVFQPDTPVKAVKLTPSHVSMLRHFSLNRSNIELAIVGGEALKPTHLDLLLRLNPNMKVYNEYGPTEATVGCTVEPITDAAQPINIGKPIPNCRIYILDEQQQPLPFGKIGEIYIGGTGLALGYWNNAELTHERFLPDQFAHDPEARMYRTGDLGKWLPQGKLQFLGRTDHQVKIRGYRIEVSEIEKALDQFPGIEQSVVLSNQDDQSNDMLVAYLKMDRQIQAGDIRTRLEGCLPTYMIPSLFFTVARFPMTQNGKIDRQALLHAQEAELLQEDEFIEPANELESWLRDLFQPLVSIPRLSVRENLFTVGLDSLKVVAAQNQIEEKFPDRIKIHEIFSNPTVQKLALIIDPSISQGDSAVEDIQILDF